MIVDDACEAVRTGAAVSCIHFEHAYLIFPYLYMLMHFRSGIKGPTVLSLHQAFQLPTAVVIDDLHDVYLGATRHLFHLWFKVDNRGKEYYVGHKVQICNFEAVLCIV